MTELLNALKDMPASVPFAALVTIGLLSIWRGWWVPMKRLEEVREDRDTRLAEQKANFDDRDAEREEHYKQLVANITSERDQWRTAYFTSEESVSALLSQNGELKELARTGVHLLSSLPQPSEGSEQT